MPRTVSPGTLRDRLDAGDGSLGDDVALVDTRDAESFDAWRIPGARRFTFGPREELDGRLAELREVVGDAEEVVVVCAKGISSRTLAEELEAATDEFAVSVVEAGMEGWSRVHDAVAVDVTAGERDGVCGAGLGSDPEDAAERVPAGEPLVVQVQRRATGCLGYVVGDPGPGEAIVVDPTADLDAFRDAVADADLEVVGVVDTHVHADHVSGGPALARELEVPYYLGEAAAARGVERDHEPLGRNEVLDVGEVAVKALATPGHTTESISLLVDDRAVLTADALHADAVGRTELESGEAERGARELYRSLHRTLLALPDSVAVLPGHVTVRDDGTFATAGPGEPVATTVGEARTGLEVLRREEDAFVERLADAGEQPANYETIVAINRGARDVEDDERVELEAGPNNCAA